MAASLSLVAEHRQDIPPDLVEGAAEPLPALRRRGVVDRHVGVSAVTSVSVPVRLPVGAGRGRDQRRRASAVPHGSPSGDARSVAVDQPGRAPAGAALAGCPVAQGMPQPPQFVVSAATSRHCWPHATWSAGQIRPMPADPSRRPRPAREGERDDASGRPVSERRPGASIYAATCPPPAQAGHHRGEPDDAAASPTIRPRCRRRKRSRRRRWRRRAAPPGPVPPLVRPTGSMPVPAVPVGLMPVPAVPVGSTPVPAVPVGSTPVPAVPVRMPPVPDARRSPGAAAPEPPLPPLLPPAPALVLPPVPPRRCRRATAPPPAAAAPPRAARPRAAGRRLELHLVEPDRAAERDVERCDARGRRQGAGLRGPRRRAGGGDLAGAERRAGRRIRAQVQRRGGWRVHAQLDGADAGVAEVDVR